MKEVDLSELSELPEHISWNTDNKTFTAKHQYLDNSPLTEDGESTNSLVQIAATDDDNTQGPFGSTTLRVDNRPPNVSLEAMTPIDENGTATLGTITDDGSLETFTLDIGWGYPLPPPETETIDLENAPEHVTFDADTRRFTVEYRYLDDGASGDPSAAYEISVTVIDNDGLSGDASTTAQVNNVPPGVTLDAVAPILENGTATLSGTITDLGSLDTFTLEIGWGDPLSPPQNAKAQVDESLPVIGAPGNPASPMAIWRLKPGDRLHSRYFGIGTVITVTPREHDVEVIIDFDEEGRTTLGLVDSPFTYLIDKVRYLLRRLTGRS